jgi:hypothetical protein
MGFFERPFIPAKNACRPSRFSAVYIGYDRRSSIAWTIPATVQLAVMRRIRPGVPPMPDPEL